MYLQLFWWYCIFLFALRILLLSSFWIAYQLSMLEYEYAFTLSEYRIKIREGILFTIFWSNNIIYFILQRNVNTTDSITVVLFRRSIIAIFLLNYHHKFIYNMMHALVFYCLIWSILSLDLCNPCLTWYFEASRKINIPSDSFLNIYLDQIQSRMG